MTLDKLFESTDEIGDAVNGHLSAAMSAKGYLIYKTLVTDISPDIRVKAAMNEINASRRYREAAIEKAEAEKILQVKRSEAEAEAKHLQGVGVARQREAIIDGYRKSISAFSGSLGIKSSEAMVRWHSSDQSFIRSFVFFVFTTIPDDDLDYAIFRYASRYWTTGHYQHNVFGTFAVDSWRNYHQVA
jgi:hypothetical protein